MNGKLGVAAIGAGAAAVVWVAVAYVGSSPLAVAMTVLIGVVYAAGVVELWRFDRETAALAGALERIAPGLAEPDGWLATLPAALRDVVRLRLEGERVALPGPAVTPYLVGLLVMLGMLGTFLGMVVTLDGAVLALAGSSELSAMRSALAAPIHGLGLAFGTSVAGVAASAMLGLASALCRRARLLASQRLDARIATDLGRFSLPERRRAAYRALEAQADALPGLVERLDVLMRQVELRGERLNAGLIAGQEQLHATVTAAHADLARAVAIALRETVGESARLARESIGPVVEATLAGIAGETTRLHAALTETVATRLDALAVRFDGTATSVSEAWEAGLGRHERAAGAMVQGFDAAAARFAGAFEERTTRLVAGVDAANAARNAELAAFERQRLETLESSFASIAGALRDEWRATTAEMFARQQAICDAFERSAHEIAVDARAQSGATIREVAALAEAAAAAPRAAAEALGQLRGELSASLARDHRMLEERREIMAAVAELLGVLEQGAARQRDAVESLVTASTATLERVGAQLSNELATGAAKLDEAAAGVAGGAVEIASLGEAFAFAVQRFADAGDALATNLGRIEGSLEKSIARSDEQLAYTVAQAREIVDLSLLSQQRLVADIERITGRRAILADEAC